MKKQPVMYKGTPIRTLADFSVETLQARREWNNIFKVIQGKNLQSKIFYPARILFRTEGKIKNLTDKQMLKECITTKPVLQEVFKEYL